jgi:hypothetical protein
MDEAGESRGGHIDQRAMMTEQFEENCAEEEPTLLLDIVHESRANRP